MKKKTILYKILPPSLYAGLVLLLSLSLMITRTRPVIFSLEPIMASPGDSIVLTGRNFGNIKAKVYIDNILLTTTFLESWSDNSIKLRVPP